jgi:serine/threonine protein kinase
MKGSPGFPETYSLKNVGSFKALCMELLGDSLFQIFTESSRKRLGPTMVLTAFKQLLFRLESLHNRGFLHRDVKPQNMLLGVNENKKRVYLIDFGLSRLFYD